MDIEVARESRSVDPVMLGRRLRDARLARGLTQGALAEGLVSPAYISRIEAGNRRPDTRLLEQLAQRLGTTSRVLVTGLTPAQTAELELALDHAELELKSGEPGACLSRLERLSQDHHAGLSTLDVRANALRAAALEAIGDYPQAIETLEALAAHVTAEVPRTQLLTALSRCYRESGDLARAIEVGARAGQDAATQGLTGTSESVQLALTVAAAYFERGDVNHALSVCVETIRQAEELGSPTALAAAYWNSSVMHSRQGDVHSAAILAKKAIALLDQGEDARNAARLRGQLAIIQLRMEPPDLQGAQTNVGAALREMEWCHASVVDKMRVRLTAAKIELLSGNHAEAARQTTACLDSTRDRAPLLAAEAHVVLGQIAHAEQRPEEAGACYRSAVHLLTGMGADRAAGQLWFDLGGLLHQVGDDAAALDAYRRAAVSTGLVTASRESALT